jgi:two-component sensor histidine kinase/PAS domain-containing protein
MREEDHSDPFAGLRQRAEQTLRERPASLDDLSPREVQRLVHELQVHQIELEMQNEELRRAQEELEASRARYLDLYDLAPVGYFTLNAQGTILEANLTAAGLLRVERGRLIGRPLTRFIVKADQDVYYFHRRELFETGAPQVCDLRLVRGDDFQFYARLEAVVADGVDGAPVCRAAVSDVSARVQAEERVKAALGEKEVLLREVHHRVKNNLRVLISLIDLQIKKAHEHPQTLQALAALQRQIRAIAMVYEKLYQVQDLGRIDFGAYLRELVLHLSRGLRGERDIALRVEAEDAFVSVNVAIPCGLMVNELVTNALKHAFPSPPLSPPQAGGTEGETGIWVEFGEREGEYVLVVGDNGVGLPPGLDWRTTDSLGLKLVNLWATHQLGGDLQVDTHPYTEYNQRNGTSFTIRFPKKI